MICRNVCLQITYWDIHPETLKDNIGAIAQTTNLFRSN